MSHVKLDINAAVATFAIDNPPHGYVNARVLDDLARAFYAIERDNSVRAVVLTGALPGVFVQHFDLREIEATSAMLNARGSRYEDYYVRERPIDALFRRIEASHLPVIAAINGNARGIGVEIALACDFRIMQRGDFGIGLPEIRIGTLPGAGGTQRLPRLIGLARATEMILFGRSLSPDQAYDWGLVNETTDGPVLDRAIERAQNLARLPPIAVAHAKHLLRQAIEQPLYQGLERERALFMDLLARPDAQERLGRLNSENLDLRTIDRLY